MQNVARNKNIDLLKGIAILLVIFGHSIQYSNGRAYRGGMFFDNSVFTLIYGMHMPLFMLISGYLFSKSISKKTLKELVLSRFTGLIIPIASWTFIELFVGLLLRSLAFDFYYLLMKFPERFFGNLWFLWAIFYCSILAIVINKILNNSRLIYLSIILLLLFSTDSFDISVHKYMYLYFIAPFVLSTEFLEKKVKEMSPASMLYASFLSIVVYLILVKFWKRESYIYISGFSLLGKDMFVQLGIDLYRWIVGIVGVCSFVFFGAALPTGDHNNIIISLFAAIGCRSLGLYIISNFAYKYIVQRLTDSFSFSWTITFFTFLCVTCFSLLVTILIQRYRFTNYILLGNRK